MSIEDIEKDIYSSFASLATTIGYSEIHGRIIAALMVSDKKLSLQDLSEKTGYSISTLSLSLDLLEFFGMIKKIKNAGDRKLYLQLNGDLLEGLKRAFTVKIQKSVTDSLNRFKEYKENLKDSKDKDKSRVINVLNILEQEIQRLDKYINLLSKLKLQ
jgi:DNA-binding transcriptional regulator GbsR (MarR family)